jgi:Carboxypeptidase regulatory-like domain
MSASFFGGQTPVIAKFNEYVHFDLTQQPVQVHRRGLAFLHVPDNSPRNRRIGLCAPVPRRRQHTRPCCLIATFGLLLAFAILCPRARGAQAPERAAELRCQIMDEDGRPVERAEVILREGAGGPLTVYTDATGRFKAANLSALRIHLTISKPGFFRIDDREIDLRPGQNELSLTLNHETEIQEKLEVQSTPIEIDPEATGHQESLVQHEILDVPVASSHNLQQSLQILPQVIADSQGTLHVAGARPDETEVMLDGFEINDPATGGFSSRVNVDAVRVATLETGGYGAEYAHAGAGMISLDTQSGDDRWRFGTTNFIPGISFQQGTHFGNWYPRVTFSGPIRKRRAWFSEAVSAQHTFHLVKELPAGQNTDSQWLADNLIRAQINLTARNILQGSFLFNRSSDPQLGLGPFSPLSTTTAYGAHRYFVSVRDQAWVGQTLVDVGLAADTGHSENNPQGSSPYVVTPSGTSGNYFQRISQASRRLQFVGNITTESLGWLGAHTLSVGWNADALDFSQLGSRRQIDFKRADGTLAERATFAGPAAFRLSNTQAGGYVQDLWRPFEPVVISVGVRADWDRLIHEHLVQPRVALNWMPVGDGRMKFTVSWGEHYQPLNLATLGMGFDQQRMDVFFDSTGLVPLGPPVVSSFVVPLAGLSQPRFRSTAAEWDAKLYKSTFVGASFLLRESRDGLAWESRPGGIFALANDRNDRYIAGEIWVRHSFGEKALLQVDYTRSRASSTQILDPTLADLILAPQQSGPLLWDAPHRVVASGWTPIPVWGLFLSGFLEYRTGFPFSILNQQQQLVGSPNASRFPNYVSLNLGVEKRFRFHGHQWAVRLSEINLTGHNNPNSVVNNVDAPNFLTFGGGQGRAFTARLRLVTQH